MLAAWLAVASEAAVATVLGTPWSLGQILLTPLVLAAPLGLVVAGRALRADGDVALGADLFGRKPWLAAILFAAIGGGVAVLTVGRGRLDVWDLAGLAVAAVFEEALFRVALPVCIHQCLRRMGAERAAVPIAGTVAAVAFAVMPGHLAQTRSPVELVPFLCLGLLLLGVVWIGRDPWLAAATHFGVNAWMLAAVCGAVSGQVARIGTAAVIIPVGIAVASRHRMADNPAFRPERDAPLPG